MTLCPKCGSCQTAAVQFCGICGTYIKQSSPLVESALSHWEQRDGSLFGALFSVIKQLFSAPTTFFRKISNKSTVGSALLFVILITLLILPSMLFYSYFTELFVSMMGTESTSSLFEQYGAGYPIMETVLQPAAIAATSLISLLFWSIFYHTLFKGVGIANGKYKETLITMSYAKAPMILFLLPLPMFTQLIAGIWTFALEIIGLAKVHKAETSRVFFTMFISSLVVKTVLLLLVILVVLFAVSLLLSAGLLTAELLPYKDLLDFIR